MVILYCVDHNTNNTIPCANGSACNIKGNTPGPPHFTPRGCHICDCHSTGFAALPTLLGTMKRKACATFM